MKKIIVAVDFSQASRKAAEYAAMFAKSFDAELVLVHGLFAPTPIGDLPGYIPVSLSQLIEENEASLQTEMEFLVDKFQVKVDGYVRMGTGSAVIKEIATEVNADLIIMGMKGAGEAGGIFGSTVTASLKKVKTPVLVVPVNASYFPIKRICYAADFENLPRPKKFHVLETIASKFDSEVKIVHVQKGNMMHAGEISVKMGSDHFFERMNHSFHKVEDEDVESGISRFLEEHSTDLLVMVAHYHNIFERIFGTSHTKLVTYQTKVPLLVLHD